MTEYAILGALLFRALGHELPAFALGIAYAITDEFHQHFVRGRHASPLDVAHRHSGVAIGIFLYQPSLTDTAGAWHRTCPMMVDRIVLAHRCSRRPTGVFEHGPVPGTGPVSMRAIAIELDGVLGDTRPLWTTGSRMPPGAFTRLRRSIRARCPTTEPRPRRSSTAGPEQGVGDWRASLGRFAEDRAPVYLRPDAEVSAALRHSPRRGDRLGVFTDAPEALARIAVSQLGAERRIEALETGDGALDRLLERLGPGTTIVRQRAEPPYNSTREGAGTRRSPAGRAPRAPRQLNAEVHALNRRLDTAEHLAPIVYELRALNESLQALAYAALGQQAPQIRRRRAG